MMEILVAWFQKTERARWAGRVGIVPVQTYRGLPSLDPASQMLYGEVLPRGVPVARLMPDRPPVNRWMAPHELAGYAYQPGQIILGKLANKAIGYLDDRPMVTIAGARAGKTSTVLEPNLYLYPGSMLVLDPKGELSHTARLRRMQGHTAYVLDPFMQSGERSACYNVLDELDPDSWTIIDDVATIAQSIIVDDGDPRAQHWINGAREILKGLILLTLTLPPPERHLVTVRQLLCLTYSQLVKALKAKPPISSEDTRKPSFYDENRRGVEVLLKTMADMGHRFGGVLAAIGNRFLAMPSGERGSMLSTAAVQTDFLDSLPLRAISTRSDFSLRDLRGSQPVTIYLCLPVGRMESHYRWLRLIVRMACTVLERLGSYPRGRTPILFMMEEFATLGRMEIMERAAAYFPGFGVKLWAVLQDAGQLKRHYDSSWETFLGNAGLVQCWANGDQTTLDYIAGRLEKLIMPFELRTSFSRKRFSQLLMFEGEPPAAAMRLAHEDVAIIRSIPENRTFAVAYE